MTEIEMHIDTLEKLIPEIEMGMNLFSYDRSALQAALQALRRTAEDDKAREEGRLVMLPEPRKPLVWGDDDQDTVLCPDCGKDLMGVFDGELALIQCPNCGQYIDGEKAITRQEAEAALGGGEGG